ncbi:MAG: DUF5606 domain-containing protein [Prevotellaceae bacterium]|jgi:hypothetical protein|nr:DUF5606 domain-containing protein [Prevotellaceae bacterium]
MQTDLQKILSISGYSGLYRYLSQARHGVVVESLKDKKRICLPTAAKMSSLSDITIYTETSEDLMLKDVFVKIREKYSAEKILSHKSSTEELMSFFGEIVPEYSKNKVFASHVKKIVEWYNLLQEYDMLEFTEKETTSEENAISEENAATDESVATEEEQ